MEVIKDKKRSHLKSDIQTKQADEKTSKPKGEFDSPWKSILTDFFQDFMALCWPAQYDQICWEKGYKMLDKELSKIARNAPIKNKIADKLVEVTLKSGEAIEILIHIEIQGKKELNFEERMFIYYYRIFDRHRKPIASLAVLIDGNHQWRPSTFNQSLWGTSIEHKFPILKISDFLDKKSELEASHNPFSTVILAQLAVLVKQPHDAKLTSKVGLIQWLYRKGWKRDNVTVLFNFIDWVIALPESYEEKFREEIEMLEGEMKVQYINTFERHGIKKGIEQGIDLGIQKGEGTILLRLLQRKFKKVPDVYRERIEQADAETLLAWGDRFLESEDLEEIFKA